VPAPNWDPDQISSRALEQLDANDDAVIDAEEAQKAPGLAAALARIDADGDGRMSAEEIKSRIELYERTSTGLMTQKFQILLDGRPLIDARIDFEPEEFLEGIIKPASGYTDGSGSVDPQTVDQAIPAMQVGFYRVVPFLPPDEKPLQSSNAVGVEVSLIDSRRESGTPVLRFKRS
jgi:hypothetical protein